MTMFRRLLKVPAADNTDNDRMVEVVGNKSDAAAAGAVTTTDTIMGYVKQLVTAAIANAAGTTPTLNPNIQTTVAGLAIDSPLASGNLWTISGGPVLVHEIFGIVTTVIQTQATNCKISLDPADGGTNVDLCANLDLTAQATGTINRVTKDFSEALVAMLDAFEATDIHAPGMILQPGNIIVTYGAASTGVISWYCTYSSLGGTLVTAAA